MRVSALALRQGVHRLLGRVDLNRRAVRDGVVIFTVAAVSLTISEWFDLFVALMKFQAVYGDWGLDDLAMMLIVLAFALAAYTWRRLEDLKGEAQARLAAEAEAERSLSQLTAAQKFLNTIVDNIPVSIFVRALPEANFVLVNRDAERLLGSRRDTLLGKRVDQVFPSVAAQRIQRHDAIQLGSREPVLFGEEVAVPKGTSETRITVSTGLAIRDEHDAPLYLVNVVQDVTERKLAEERIEHMAHHDPLTDLPNRAAFNDTLCTTLDRAKATGEKFAVLCIDLNRFKEVNDVFGHATGDSLLCEVAKRLQAVCGAAFLARLGGDEFTVLCAEGPQPTSAEILADRMLAALEGDIEIGGQILRAGMSIGVAVYPTDGETAKVLQANADAALYRAKTEARGSMRFFAAENGQASARAPRAAARFTLGAGAARDQAPLPATGLDGRQNHRLRGAGALAASDARRGSPRRVHSARRG